MEDVVDCTLTMLKQPESWLLRELEPNWQWMDLRVQALARITDAAEFSAWVNTRDGQKNRNRPKPFPRPQVSKREPNEIVAVDIDTLNKLLGV